MSTFAAGASGNDRRDLIKSQPAENSAETTTKFLAFKQEVRDALLNVQIGIELENFKKPHVLEKLRYAMIKLYKSMAEPLGTKESDSEMDLELRDLVDKLFDNPSFLEKIAIDTATSYLQTSEEVRERWNVMCEQCLGLYLVDANVELLDELKNISQDLVRHRGLNDKVIEYIIEKAAKTGIDIATSRDGIAEAMRHVLPTAEDYRAYYLQAIQLGLDIMQKIIDVVKKVQGEGGMWMDYSGEMSMIKVILDFSKYAMEDRLADIYGTN